MNCNIPSDDIRRALDVYTILPVGNYGHVMSIKVSYLKQAKLFSSKSFLNFCDPSSRFLINWFLIKKIKKRVDMPRAHLLSFKVCTI